MSSRTLNSSVSIQASQIYDNGKDRLKVLIPDIQRQSNYSDCGVFAIANLTEILFTNFTVDFSSVRFDISKMRQHLLDCFGNGTFTPFPKIGKMPKMPCKDAKNQTIKLFCTCKLPDIVGDMVKCDNRGCKIKWFHKKCVGFIETVRGQKWLCNYCTW